MRSATFDGSRVLRASWIIAGAFFLFLSLLLSAALPYLKAIAIGLTAVLA
jgi:hypothetical protein